MSEEQRNQPSEQMADAVQPAAGDRAEQTAAEKTGVVGAVGAAGSAAARDAESAGSAAEQAEAPVPAAATAPATKPATSPAAAAAAARAGRAKPVVGASRAPSGITGSTVAEAHDIVGEGSPRYGDAADEIPPHGSEQSWSAAPHPGYVADTKFGSTGKRLAAGTLIGCLVLAFGVYFSVRILTGRSSNGFGAAPWTAAVEKGGAVVGGINAQNDGAAPPIALPAGVTFGTAGSGASAAVYSAVAACQAAIATTGQTTTGLGGSRVPGAPATLGDWATQATPSVNSLRGEAAALGTAVASKDPAAVAATATALCTSFTNFKTLPPIPDATASRYWAVGVTAYAQAASNALRGVSGNPGALLTAQDDLRTGDAQFDSLSARIATVA